eukprot:gnl/TRDRNA2_/TRDRNA2_126458_c0_seq1.p1 gnl/TRDRNA2_/TRDRNA2_126458_c0~~gnl/TRDRNA2_/TRDRNA2_126458_c0_seq1.p1  ORF type:complete len:206 (-),score=22.06 gnl/TRDRNA2_/TRDRNA2_126458_c0_seq1:53-670(-)
MEDIQKQLEWIKKDPSRKGPLLKFWITEPDPDRSYELIRNDKNESVKVWWQSSLAKMKDEWTPYISLMKNLKPNQTLRLEFCLDYLHRVCAMYDGDPGCGVCIETRSPSVVNASSKLNVSDVLSNGTNNTLKEPELLSEFDFFDVMEPPEELFAVSSRQRSSEGVDVIVPGLIAMGSFVFIASGIKTFYTVQKPDCGVPDPLMHT